MYNLELRNYIKTHADWEVSLTEEPYFLKLVKKDNYIMFKYSQLNSDFSNPIAQECRGIVLDINTLDCVCHAFNKFGNYGESYCPELTWNNISVQEKIDGSLMKVWFHNGTWHLSTNGQIDAADSDSSCSAFPTFKALFLEALKKYGFTWESFTNTLDTNYTYMFELTSPYNRVVIEYFEFSLHFLGARNMITGKETTSITLPDVFISDMPKRYKLNSLNQIIAAAEALDWNEEGYVVCDNNFNRVKIKSPKYVMAHYSRTNGNISRKRLVEIVQKGEIAEFLIYANDYANAITEIQNEIESAAKELTQAAIDIKKSANWQDRKEYAKLVSNYPRYAKAFLFDNFNKELAFSEYIDGWIPEKLLRFLDNIKEYKEKHACQN